MALTKLVRDGYGQLELNQVMFPRTGAVEAQCEFVTAFTASAPAEVGMILEINVAARTVALPAVTPVGPFAINYSTEQLYDQFHQGLKNFYQIAGQTLPRLGYLTTGEKFTTSTIAYDSDEFTLESDLKAAVAAAGTTKLYGAISQLGDIKVTLVKPTVGPVLQVIKASTMPDGSYAVKFQVI